MRSAAILLVLVACGTNAATPTSPPAPATTASAAAVPAPTTSRFGGRAVWAPVTTPFVAARIRVVQSTSCAVSTTGKAACWGQIEQDDDSVAVERRAGVATPHELVGVDNVIDVVREWFYLCVAQREGSGDGGCFVTNDIGRTAPVFPKPPLVLQPAEGICAVFRDGTAGCVDLDGKFTAAPGIRDAVNLTCRQDACCAITRSGAVSCWGKRPPALPKLANVAALAWVWDDGCAVTKTGAATCWGDAKALATTHGVREVGVRSTTVCLVLADGALRCAGDSVAAASNVAQLDDACIRHADGSVSCTGTGDHGELGDGSVLLSPVPVQVPDLADVVDLNVAHTNACALKRGGSLMCWGPTKPAWQGTTSGAFVPGQYVSGCRTDGSAIRCSYAYRPGEWEVAMFAAPGITRVKTAALHRDSSVCIVDDGGAVQCRHGLSEGGLAAKWLPLASPAPVEQLVPLSTGFCARHANGRASCWVDHRYDNDDDFLETVPTQARLTYVDGISGVTQLAAGQDEACAITKDAEVWCFAGEHGKPVKLPALTGASSLGANHRHACAVVRGDVWCWGDNFLGQLGTGTGGGRIRPVLQPVKVPATFKAVKVGTGRDSTCALDDQGKVWCWGTNARGELGLPRLTRSDGWSRVVRIGPP